MSTSQASATVGINFDDTSTIPFPQTGISEDAPTFFATLLSSPPSVEAVALLAGRVAAYMCEQQCPQIAALYLQVVARHLVPPAEQVANNPSTGGTSNRGLSSLPQRNDERVEILQAVGYAAAKCSPRSAISQSGILLVLARLIPSPPYSLCSAQVELMQCALLAGQYRYARRLVWGNDVWPRPTGSTGIQQVLRYFYYRGMIHMGLDEWSLAIRCFWTCVTVPSEVLSTIAICAWKKLILCRCLLLPVGTTTAKGFQMSSSSVGGAQAEKEMISDILLLPWAASTQVARFFSVGISTKTPTTSPMTMTSDCNDNSNGAVSQAGALNDGICPYAELVSAVWNCDRATFDTVKQNHESVWTKDGNLGMVYRLEKDLLNRRVYHLSRIYSVIPLTQLSEELQLPTEDIRVLLLKLSHGGMTVDIDAEKGWVEFPDEDRLRGEAGAGNLVENMGEIMTLANQIRRLDIAIAATPRYQHLTQKEKGDPSSSSRAASGPRGVAGL
mmetsp:Transcript_2477/g.3474  ORF Transcript_2477/g.3474 Transcript_2477/m.3474 type:complete len:500 (-) Transcript_2477:30-1529(-)